jgi:hypothetical protein
MAVSKPTAQTLTVLHNFSITDGENPLNCLVLAEDTLYGSAYYLYKINTDGTDYSVLYGDFAEALAISGSTLYGGGFLPTLFSINTDGTRFRDC